MNRTPAPSHAPAPIPSDFGPGEEEAARPARTAWIRLAVLVVLLAAFASWVAWGGADLMREARQGIDALGLWGPVIFAVCYALAVTALLPGSVLTASAGALFGLPLGVGAALAGATAGAALSFGLARWLGRPVVARYAGSGRLARLDAYLTRRGFATVLLLRLVPLFPFTVINYGAGVAGVRFSSYVTATALGIVPGTVVYTGLGGSLGDPTSPALWISLAGLVVLSAGGWWAARQVRSPASKSASPQVAGSDPVDAVTPTTYIPSGWLRSSPGPWPARRISRSGARRPTGGGRSWLSGS